MGLLELLKSRRKSMYDYEYYYSKDLISTLEQIILLEATDEDFEDYINFRINYNKHNFQRLKENNMLKFYCEFDTSFHGDIQFFHKISKYIIIETTKGFYIVKENKFINNTFDTLEEALLFALFKGYYQDTLKTLYDSIKDN